MSHWGVLDDFQAMAHFSVWENYGNYEKIDQSEEGADVTQLVLVRLGTFLLIVLLSSVLFSSFKDSVDSL